MTNASLLLPFVVALASCGPDPGAERVLMPPRPRLETGRAPSEMPLAELLNVHRAFAPVALSDSDVLFLSDAPETEQIHRGRVRDKAPPIQLTSSFDRARSFRVAPSHDRLVFLRDRGGDENDQIQSLGALGADPPRPVALTADPKTKSTLPCYSPDGTRIAYTSNARNGVDMDLYIAEPRADRAERQPFLELSGSFSVLEWRADLLLLQEERSAMDEDLLVADSKTRKLVKLTQHRGESRFFSARFSAGATSVIAASDRGEERVGVVEIDIATKKITTLRQEARDVLDVDAEPIPGKSATVLAATLGAGDTDALIVLDVEAGRAAVRIEVPLGAISTGVSIAPGARYAFVGLTRSDMPGDIVRVDLESGAIEPVTAGDHGGVDVTSLARPESLTVLSFDGAPIPILFYARPSREHEKRPLVIMLHDGPQRQARPVWNPLLQYLVSRGYAVVEPDVRGSSGQGRRFMRLDDREKREDAVRDVVAVGKAMAARADIDEKKIALYGTGYGGYLVASALSHYPDFWAAGVDLDGFANLKTYLEKTAPYARARAEAEYGSPSSDAPLLDRASPIQKIADIRVPLLLVHGKRDPIASFDEALQVVDGMKRANRTVELIAFENEGHELSKRRSKLIAVPRIVEFLDRSLKREPEMP